MPGTLRFVLAVSATILGFCIADAAIDARFFSTKNFTDELLRPDHRELYFRAVGCAAIALAGFIWQGFRRRRRDAVEAKNESDKLYRDVVENSPDSIIVHRGGTMLYLNKVALAYLGVPNLEALGGKSLPDFIHPDDRESSNSRRETTLRGAPPPPPATVRLLLPNDQTRDAMVSSSRIVFEGEPAVLTFCRDVTDDVATRRDLAASRERLSLALEAAQDGVWDWDMVNDRLVYNRAWARMLGLKPFSGEHTPETWSNLVHKDDKKEAMEAAAAHIRGDVPVFEAEVRLRHTDGHYIWVLDRGKVVERAADGTPMRMTGTHRDITARKEAEIALEVRNRIAETFLTSTPDEVFPNILPLIGTALKSPQALLGTLEPNQKVKITTYDRDGGESPFVNGHQSRLEGLPSLFKKIVADRQPQITNEELIVAVLPRPLSRAITVPILSKGKSLGFLMVADRGSNYAQADAAALTSLTTYLAPILEFHMESEVKEGQLRQAQKMEAIGALAGGIAHDFNNILQAILGFSTLAREEAQAMDSQPGGLIANDLERVTRATQRGRELVNRILLFSRRQEEEQHPVDIAQVIEEAVGLLDNTIPATIELRKNLETGTRLVNADPAQISQVLLNLATNSFHAMEENGGVLTFELKSIEANSNHPLVPDSIAHLDLVALVVTDTGMGMDEATLARLYDPFFTTKDVGKGTGLGLSVVHGIVAAHRGEIIVESAVERGTTAHIFLPVIGGLDTEQAASPTNSQGAVSSARIMPGSRILFLDDEPDITALGKALLEKQGHQVLALNDSRLALEHLRGAPHDFDLLISDLTMPHLTGLQIADQIALIRPDLPLVLITGLNDLPMEEYHKHPQIRGVLRKPFGGDVLRETVRDVLHGGERPPTGEGRAASSS